jgi:transcriptional regulator with XRE-family HTH domain
MANNNIILQISNRVKEKRKENRITLETLAGEIGVTKGLLSQIENNRTIPSLSVLLSIIKALDIDLNDFFNKLDAPDENVPIIIKARDYQPVKREYSKGSFYSRITSFKHDGKLVDVVLYRQQANARRGFVSTQAFEFDYIVKGKIQYTINNKKYVLEEGDSFYYDARQPHHTKCLSAKDCVMLVIYFFNDAK